MTPFKLFLKWTRQQPKKAAVSAQYLHDTPRSAIECGHESYGTWYKTVLEHLATAWVVEEERKAFLAYANKHRPAT